MGQLSATKTIGGLSSTTFKGFGFNPTPVTVAPGSGFSFAVGKSEPSKPLETVSERAGKLNVHHRLLRGTDTSLKKIIQSWKFVIAVI